MVESLEYELLVEKAGERYVGNDYIVIREGKIEGKHIDLVILKDLKIIRLIEVIKSQLIKKVTERLLSINIACEKEIVRKYKNKNPLARKVIDKVKSQGIIFTEINL